MKFKTLLCINLAAVFVCMVGIIGGILHFQTLVGINQIEGKHLTKRSARLSMTIDRELEVLKTIAHDWSDRTDSANFMSEKDLTYSESNFTQPTLENLQSIGIVYLDPELNIHHEFAKAGNRFILDRLVLQLQQYPEKMLEVLRHTDDTFLLYDKKSLSFFACAVHEITKSEDYSKFYGYFAIFRELDLHFMNRIGTIFGEELTLKLKVPSEDYQRKLLNAKITPRKQKTEIQSTQTAILLVGIPDLTSRYVACFSSEILRDLNIQLRNTLISAIVLLAIFSLVIILGNIIAINHLILQPIQRLSKGFAVLANTSALSTRLDLSGPVEIQELATSANRMLNVIDRQHSQLRDLSRTDSLTSLCNRRYFDECLAIEFSRCIRDQLPVSILMIDVDHFKLYNDAYGHGAGDVALQTIADVLTHNISRVTDVIGRYGGEEFIALLCNTPASGAETTADKIHKALESRKILHRASKTNAYVTCSIGCSTIIPDCTDTAKKLIAHADRNLYLAKSSGRAQTMCDNQTNEC